MFPNVKIIGFNLSADFNTHILTAIPYEINPDISQYEETWLECQVESTINPSSVIAKFMLPDGTVIKNIHLAPVYGLENRFRVRLNEIIGNQLIVGVENHINVLFTVNTKTSYATMSDSTPVDFYVYKNNLDNTYTPDDIDVLFIGLSKLNSDIINAQANALKVDDVLSLNSINPVQNRIITAALNQKVDKEEGKTLTSNDFTDEYKQQLDLYTFTGVDNFLSLDSRNPVENKVITENLNNKINLTEKGQANGVASLDPNGKIFESQLPDTILGQLKFRGIIQSVQNDIPVAKDNKTGILLLIPTAEQIVAGTVPEGYLTPAEGDYFISNVNFAFEHNDYIKGDWLIWTNNVTGWAKIDNTDAVQSVNNKTGNVIINKTDIGLGNVDNTSDISKEVYSAIRDSLGNVIHTTYAKNAQLKNYYTKTDIGDLNKYITSDNINQYNFALKSDLDTKQDLLVDSGEKQNIKTINGKSILGTGDLEIQGTGGSDVSVTVGENGLASSITVNNITTNLWNSTATPEQISTLYTNIGGRTIEKTISSTSTNLVENQAIGKGFNTMLDQINLKQNKLTAGAGISITDDGTISASVGVSFKKVDVLPETGDPLYIYLVPSTGSEENAYDEYAWIENKWEKIGSTAQSLEGYATETWVTDKGYDTVTNVDNKLLSKVDTETFNTELGKKLDKIAEQEKVYATDGLGDQTSLQYNVEPYGNGLVKRTSDGRVKTASPTEDNDAVNKSTLTSELLKKQDTLVGTEITGQNIKTINGETLLGTGNIVIEAKDPDLTDYYKKTETYNQTEINNKLNLKQDQLTSGAGISIVGNIISATASLQFKVVDVLPETGEASTIYLLPHDNGDKNLYDEYIFVEGIWEKIGSTATSLAGYATETWVQQQGYLTTIPDEYLTEDELLIYNFVNHTELENRASKVTFKDWGV